MAVSYSVIAQTQEQCRDWLIVQAKKQTLQMRSRKQHLICRVCFLAWELFRDILSCWDFNTGFLIVNIICFLFCSHLKQVQRSSAEIF